MGNDVFTFIVGGKAGEGVKKAGEVAAKMFVLKGLHVFLMDDYMSLIRGGHNFSVISAADRPITSHYMRANLVVNSDRRSYEKHKTHLSEDGVLIYNQEKSKDLEGFGIPLMEETKKYKMKELMYGVGAVATLAAAIDLSKKELNQILEDEYPSGKKDNLAYASKIYDLAHDKIGGKFQLNQGDKQRTMITGNEAISLGALGAGLNCYYGYPMTPTSSILHFLAKKAPDFDIAVVHPENEIAVINMAIGSAYAGAKTMVGSSGGGVALMSEGISLAGMAEVPILVIYSMRAGPASGVPTYTEQADLGFALNLGHGEFPRIVASPGSIEEAYYLTAEMLDLVWKFQTPGILLTEKHLSESKMDIELELDLTSWAMPKLHENGDYKRYLDTENGISPLLFPPSDELIKWNSYEHDESGITTEDEEVITQMHDKRFRKAESLLKYLKNKNTINTYGSSGPLIFTYGSTTMSVLEALQYSEREAQVIQPRFLKPFPVWELSQFHDESAIVVEQSKAGQFSQLLTEKTKIQPTALINRYDGRPFEPIQLAKKIKEVIS